MTNEEMTEQRAIDAIEDYVGGNVEDNEEIDRMSFTRFLRSTLLTFAKKIREDTLNDLTFLIWSNEHEEWWNPARRGYTPSIDEAGRYLLKDAIGICTEANKYIGFQNESIPKEVMTLSPESIRALERNK